MANKPNINSAEYTADRFYNGKVFVKQHKIGYRFSIDAILLAGYADPKPGDRVMDVGTGCGIIPLLLAFKCNDLKIYGIEIQKALADLAIENVVENKLQDQVDIISGDIRNLKFDKIGKPLDLMVSNPPYRPVDSGKINPDSQKAQARHELSLELADVIHAARRFLKISGRLVMIYPAERAVDLISKMREFGIEPKMIRMIHSCENTPAKLIIVEGIKGGGPEVKIAPPLYIYNDDGSYTEAIENMMAGQTS